MLTCRHLDLAHVHFLFLLIVMQIVSSTYSIGFINEKVRESCTCSSDSQKVDTSYNVSIVYLCYLCQDKKLEYFVLKVEP